MRTELADITLGEGLLSAHCHHVMRTLVLQLQTCVQGLDNKAHSIAS